MSMLYPDQNQGCSVSNFDMFSIATTKSDRLHEAPSDAPLPKRRRGRPSKCPQIPEGQPSPAASSSAAVVKQGTPKASAPLMRVSPLNTERRIDSSPLQHKRTTPSPRGGTLMKMDISTGKDLSPTKQKKAKPPRTKKNNFYTMLPNKITLATQQNLHAITNDTSIINNKFGSLNPSLLLSSPMSASKINEINKNRVPVDVKKNITISDTTQNKMNPPSSTIALSSSPMTPNSVSSSCFSSIMRSSPLYHGYYAHQLSPGTSVLASSPMRLQMKPLNEVKAVLRKAVDIPIKLIEKIPETTVDEENEKKQETIEEEEEKEEESDKEGDDTNYKLSFGIDEYGQAKIIRVKVTPELKQSPSPTSKPAISSMKLTRHQSLATLPTLSSIGRTSSLSSIPTLKSNDLGLFMEPSKIAHDNSFFNSISDELGFETMSTPPHQEEFNFADEMSTTSEEGLMIDDGDDESRDCDARNALMKMIRRSV